MEDGRCCLDKINSLRNFMLLRIHTQSRGLQGPKFSDSARSKSYIGPAGVKSKSLQLLYFCISWPDLLKGLLTPSLLTVKNLI